MIKLYSNGKVTTLGPWMGHDPSRIVYPAVSSCLTITCVVGNVLYGMHLACVLTDKEKVDGDLETFGDEVARAGTLTAVYVIGVFGSWVRGPRNMSGYQWNDGSLPQRLADVLQFTGNLRIAEASGKINVMLNDGVVTCSVDSATVAPPFEYVAVACTPKPKKKTDSNESCVIL